MSEETKTPKRGVGTAIKERLLAGDDNAAALAAVKAEFPESATTLSTVSWYRTNLRKEDKSVPTAREASKAKAADPLD